MIVKTNLLARSAILFLIIIVLGGKGLSANINVGEEVSGFSSIQDAIDAARPGDTIDVHSGTYAENIRVNKSLTIKGEANPIIDVGSQGSPITLSGNGIMLEGFVLKNSGKDLPGIVIHGANNFIKNNTITYCYYGIMLDSANNNTISNNTIMHNQNGGILLQDSNFNNITNNFLLIVIRTSFYNSYFLI